MSGDGEENLLRQIWRRLPPGLRSPVARWATQSLAPRIDADAWFDRSRPWVVAGFLSSPSGLGRAARLAHTALQREGHDVYGVDLSDAFYEASGVVPYSFREGRRLDGPANVLVNVNAPYMGYALSLLGARFIRGKAVLGYWVWELEQAPADWTKGAPCVHAVAAPSVFAAGALRRVAPRTPVLVVPHPVALGPLPRVQPPSRDAPFTVNAVMSAASGFERKNPIALVRAFRLAFGDAAEAQLRLRVTNLQHYPPGAAQLRDAIGAAGNIELCAELLSDDALAAWWGAPHLYASLHRAEGFGLPIAEAMCAGVPALATDWSASAEYVNETNGYPIRAALTSVRDPQSKYQSEGRWGEPDIAHAAARLREAAADEAQRQARGAAAREAALRRFSAFDLSALYSASADLHKG